MSAHIDLLAAQYLASCQAPNHPCHQIMSRPAPARNMKATLQTKHADFVRSFMATDAVNVKQMHKAIHTSIATTAINALSPNPLIGHQPPAIDPSEQSLSRQDRTMLSQLRSGHCRLLSSYQNKLNPAIINRCAACGHVPEDVAHLFTCPHHPTPLTPIDLWHNPTATAKTLCHLQH
jgi:hypothetical protein